MGRQWNQIIESLGPLTGGTMSINANLSDIEALLTTLQADVADGIASRIEGWDIPIHDYRSFGYTGSNISSITYKTGGSGGTTVATLTLAYDGSGNLTSMTKT